MIGDSTLFCFGLGYVAEALARSLQAEGWLIAGTTRSQERYNALAAAGLEPYVFERGTPLKDPGTALGGTTHLLVSIPPDREGDPVLDLHGGDLAALSGLRWAGYLSTTGVYGDAGGDWVDEESPLRPSLDRTRRRVAAERAWLDLQRIHGVPLQVFRLAGIYGPGRSALDSVRAGRARRIDKPGQVFSRIHVEDIVGLLRASMAHPEPGTVYNLCDDEPAPSHEVIAEACALLGREPPPLEPFEQADLSPMARSFYADNRRVRNARIKERLGYALRYPNYRAGLAAILASGG